MKSAAPLNDTAEKMGLLNPALLQFELVPPMKKHAVEAERGGEFETTPPYVLPSA